MIKFKEIWHKVALWGVSPNMPIHQQKGIILFNQITRILSVVLLIGAIAMSALNLQIVSYLFMVAFPFVAFSLYLNLKGKVYLSIFVIGFFLPLLFLAFSIITKIYGLTNSIFLHIAPRFGIMISTLIPIAVLGFQRFSKMLPPIAAGIVMFVFFDFFHSLFGINWQQLQYDKEYYPLVITALGVFFVIVIATMGFTQGINTHYEQIVIRQKEAIDAQNTSLKQQQEEIKAQNEEIQQQKQILEQQNREIKESIRYASRIQQALLPSAESITSIFPKSFVFFRPRDIVSGDFYWAQKIGQYQLIMAADCTGHGVPGGFMSMLEISFINSLIDDIELDKPNLLLEKLREKTIKTLHQDNNNEKSSKDGMDVAVCVFDTQHHQLFYSGAYNPLWLIRNGELIEYKATKNPIGQYKITKQYANHQIDVKIGDTFYIFSDGFQDQFHNQTGEKYKTRRLKQLLLQNHHKTTTQQLAALELEFENWKKNARQTDDVVVIGFVPL